MVHEDYSIMKTDRDLTGKVVFVTGGSGGLGKAIAIAMAARGVDVTIFARRSGPLEEARKEITLACSSSEQDIKAISLDLSNASEVESVFKSQPRIADILFCSAGGNHAENGFFVDITAAQIESCMKNNYFSAAFAAKAMLNIWNKDDEDREDAAAAKGVESDCQDRKIVFVSSAAAFVCLPGSVAYSPAKSALRALADTLRMELLRQSGPQSSYSVHCAFPGDFLSPGFREEQKTKTSLTKRIQGLDRPLEELEATFPSSGKVANLIIAAVDRGEFAITEGSAAGSLLFAAMVGPSPKRGWGVIDSLLSIIVGWTVWPFLRWKWGRMARADGEWARLARFRDGDEHL